MNFMGTYGLILVLCLVFVFGSEATPNLSSIEFSYPTFESPEDIETLGNATIENKMLQLTAGGFAHSIGRAVYSEPVKICDRTAGLTVRFKTSFTLSVKRPDLNHSGDGLAFGLFPHKLIPNSSGGGMLGLYDSTSNKSNYGVAVEFDLYMNSFDPDNNHIGLDLNNIHSACVSILRNYGINLRAGNEINVDIEYDGLTGRLNIYAINASLWDPAISNLVLSCQLNISRYIVGEEVFVGFSAATGDYSEYHTIHSWTFKAWSVESPTNGRKILAIILTVSTFSLGLFLTLLFLSMRKKRKIKIISVKRSGNDVRSNPASDLSKEIIRACDWDVLFPKKFSYEELNRATNNFDPQHLLGEGGFGDVYKGIIGWGDSEREIAVKRYSEGSRQSEREYISEVVVIGRLRQRNLVQLQGWCHDSGELMLVYDYMPHGSLDQLLYDPSNVLDWPKRFKICRGLAAALVYLHEECHTKVVHRDVKTSNVMVDSDYEARLGDFGLARFLDCSYAATSETTTSVGGGCGTVGYIAPERRLAGKATVESDVFSYGAVLLEIGCGRRPMEVSCRDGGEGVLVEVVWKLVKEERLLQAADPRLNGLFDRDEMERVLTVGLLCSTPEPLDRPTIRQALRFLNFEAPLPALPREKAVYYQGNGVGVSGFGAWEHGKIEWTGGSNNNSGEVDGGEERGMSRYDEGSTTDVTCAPRTLSLSSP